MVKKKFNGNNKKTAYAVFCYDIFSEEGVITVLPPEPPTTVSLLLLVSFLSSDCVDVSCCMEPISLSLLVSSVCFASSI